MEMESRFDKMCIDDIRTELYKHSDFINVDKGDVVLRLSLDNQYHISQERVLKISRSSFYLESMSGTRFDKSNGRQINHKRYTKGYVCFNTNGFTEYDIISILSAFANMGNLVAYLAHNVSNDGLYEMRHDLLLKRKNKNNG